MLLNKNNNLFFKTFNIINPQRKRFLSLNLLNIESSLNFISQKNINKNKDFIFLYQKDMICYYYIWDYLKISWTTKDIVYINGSNSFYEKTLMPLLKKFISGALIKEHFIEFFIQDFWNFNLLLTFLKKSTLTRLTLFSDLFGRECYYKNKNIVLVYNCISELTNTRFLFRIVLKNSFIMLSITDIFVSAAWVERECWDMLGVVFIGNKDLRRILTDYGFLGHPLRKEFPLTGFVEVRYNDNLKRIVFEPVEFAQEMRAFDFSNPWNQAILSRNSDVSAKFKIPQGGDINFMGVLSNTITKTTLESSLLKNFKLNSVFSNSSTFKQYLRNHNTIYIDILSEYVFFSKKEKTLDVFLNKNKFIYNIFFTYIINLYKFNNKDNKVSLRFAFNKHFQLFSYIKKDSPIALNIKNENSLLLLSNNKFFKPVSNNLNKFNILI